MSDSKSASSGGIGLGTVLFVVFLVLKLTGNIAWSWWWVTSPLWLPIAFVIAVVAMFLIVACVVSGIALAVDRWT